MSYFEYLYENANEDLIGHIIEESAYNFTIKSFEDDKIEELEILGFIVDCIINEEEIDNELVEITKNVIKYEEFTPEILADFAFQKDMFTLIRNNKHGKIWEFGNFNEYLKIMIN